MSETDLENSQQIDRCWHEIGIWGDRDCPELQSVIHCRNCPVYAKAGRSLLERETSEAVLLEWNQVKEFNALQERVTTGNETLSVMIFRLVKEWFALSTSVFKEVTPLSTVRKIPHRTTAILQGVVNVRGELQLCVSLTALMGIDVTVDTRMSRIAYERLILVEQDRDRWVFPADEIYGIHHLPTQDLNLAPAAIAHSTETYTKGVLNWSDRQISVIDHELLFYSLNHKVLR